MGYVVVLGVSEKLHGRGLVWTNLRCPVCKRAIKVSRSLSPNYNGILQCQGCKSVLYLELVNSRVIKYEVREIRPPEVKMGRAKSDRLGKDILKFGPTQKNKDLPTRDEVTIGTSQERDNVDIYLTDNRTDKTIAEWRDDDARQMFEDGFFKPGDWSHGEITGNAFENSVLDYAEYIGILKK